VISAFASMMIATVIAASPFDVRSSTNCPSTEAIVEQLLPLLPAADGVAEGQDVAEITVGAVQPDGAMELHLRLARPDASVVGERSLLMQGTCQDMAEAVAMVLAVWETGPLPSAVPVDGPATSVKEPAPSSRVQASQPVSRHIQQWQILVGAGVGAALVGGIAATGGIDFQVGNVASHWQLRFGLASESDRQLNLSPGQVGWRHNTVALGLCWHTLDPPWLLALDAGPVAGWATLAGSGFSTNRQNRSFEYGVAAGLRTGRSFGRWTLWAEWRTTLWAQHQRARATGADDGAELPQVDAAVSLGLSMLFLP
jgi:hypothetical protein